MTTHDRQAARVFRVTITHNGTGHTLERDASALEATRLADAIGPAAFAELLGRVARSSLEDPRNVEAGARIAELLTRAREHRARAAAAKVAGDYWLARRQLDEADRLTADAAAIEARACDRGAAA